MNYANLKSDVLSRLEKLDSDLHYHSLEHTLDVLESTGIYAQALSIQGTDLVLLKSAALLHDTGFLVNRQDHEEYGTKLARKILPDFNYNRESIDLICGMIMATRIPQSPNTKLGKVLCDCDLDYLGRDDFDQISEQLYAEWLALGTINNYREFDEIQLKFLTAHTYHTDFARQSREPVKKLNIEKIRQRLSTY